MDESEFKKLLELIAKLPLEDRLKYLEKALREEKEKEIIIKIEQEIHKVKIEIKKTKDNERNEIKEIKIDVEKILKENDEKFSLFPSKSLDSVVSGLNSGVKEEREEKQIKYGPTSIGGYKLESSYNSDKDEKKNEHDPLRDFEERNRFVGIQGGETFERLRDNENLFDYKRKKDLK